MPLLTIDKVIEEAESLQPDEQAIFIDVFQKRFSERRRDEIAKNGENTLNAIQEKKAKIGSVNNFINDVDNV